MTGPMLVMAALAGALVAAGITGLVVRSTPRLAPRVRPYTIVARAGLGRSADVSSVAPFPAMGGTVGRLFGPPLQSLAGRIGRFVERGSDDQLSLRLRQAGRPAMTPEQYRLQVAGHAALFAIVGAVLGAVLLRSPPIMLALALCGFLYGSTRLRGRIEKSITERRDRIRLELYTVNQLLAMHLRTGAGPVQATQRVVDRGSGVVVEELDDVLRSIRTGVSEPEAFHRAAEVTPEPGAARTYKLFAAGAERGVDLASALLALSEDLRDGRREELRKTATKRRAAMLLPTIGVLAPIMLLFIAAPLPSIIFGGK